MPKIQKNEKTGVFSGVFPSDVVKKMKIEKGTQYAIVVDDVDNARLKVIR